MSKRSVSTTTVVRRKRCARSWILPTITNGNTTRHTKVPTIIEGGVEGVVVNSRTTWIRKALAVKEHPDRCIVAHLVEDVMRTLLAHAFTGQDALGLSDLARALDLSDVSDSDAEPITCYSSTTGITGIGDRARNACKKYFRSVMIDGVEIMAKLRVRGEGIVVPADFHLANLIKVLKSRLPPCEETSVAARAAKRPVVLYTSCENSGRYTIRYTKDGSRHAKRFLVPRHDAAGNMLSAEDFKRNCELVKRRAIEVWNREDRSGLPRLHC